MKSYWSRQALIQYEGCSYKKAMGRQHGGGTIPVKTEAEWRKDSTREGHPGLPETGRGKKASFSRGFVGSMALCTR